ncbi:MAG: ABC transporter permease [Methanomassiliicoccales archaeon]|nr:ABC transporter permease [Methanomassiliicoccales archaeon]TFG55922.1 MAG: ABC transporter permease [Methanomassiliicoccus sp.]
MNEESANYLDRTMEALNKPLVKSSVVALISLTMFVLTWWAVAIWANLVYLPAPPDVLDALIRSFMYKDPNMGVNMWHNMYASLQRFILGFLLAFIVAVPLGLVMGFSKIAGLLAKPVVEVFRPIPPIAWVPFFIAVFFYFWGPVMVIFVGVLFPLLSNIYFGVKSVEPILLDAARTQGASRLQMFTKVIFPYTIPFLMTGVRIGMGIGWMCIVAAEMIGGVGGGIGVYIYVQANLGVYANMFAGMIVIAILGLLTTGIMQYFENVTNRRMGIR